MSKIRKKYYSNEMFNPKNAKFYNNKIKNGFTLLTSL